MRPRRWLVLGGLALTALAAGGCSTIGYYAQTVHGQIAMMQAARPIPELLAEPGLDARLRAKLERVQSIRAYASRELALPDNRSYTSYADLKRPFVLWNVFATPELSLRLEESCFPIAGCVGYRGFFSKEDADAYAAELRATGKDVNVSGVPAYSTLGWFDDPVLNTFIMQPDGEVARLIFHELAHQVLYVKGDTTFNESFATTVETVGVERWLAAQHDAQLEQVYAAHDARRHDFLALLNGAREHLATIYAGDASDAEKRSAKAAVFARLQDDYRAMKAERWNGFSGYDRFFAQALNNAHLASIAAYTQLVPAFEKLLASEGGDMRRFFARVKTLAAESKGDRDAAIAAWCDACVVRAAADERAARELR